MDYFGHVWSCAARAVTTAAALLFSSFRASEHLKGIKPAVSIGRKEQSLHWNQVKTSNPVVPMGEMHRHFCIKVLLKPAKAA